MVQWRDAIWICFIVPFPRGQAKKNAHLLKQWLMTALLCGVVLGTFFHARLPDALQEMLEHFCGGLAVTTNSRTLWTAFCGTELPVLLLLTALLLTGCCALGHPLAVSILLLRGMAVSAAGTDCFAAFGLQNGLRVAAAMLLPEAFLSALLLMLAARDSITISTHLLYYLFYGTANADMTELRRKALRKWAVILVLSIGAALLHTALLWFLTPRLFT